jgi:hypothetical protein
MPRSSDTDARRIDRIEIIPESPHPSDGGDSGGETAGEGAPVPAWQLGLPSALALAYLLAAVVLGPQVFDTGTATAGGFVALGALAGLLLVALWGTVRLFDDAARRRDTGSRWRPNPWAYLVGGTAILLAVPVVEVATGAVTPTPLVPYFFGTAVVAVALSSLAAGPAYLLVRWRVRSTA